MLLKSAMARLRPDELSDQHAQAFPAKNSTMSASGINRGLRTLRRAFNLAHEWGKIERPIRIALTAGERQRDRVLTVDEESKYLSACPQPWRDCGTLIIDEGFRPGEVCALRWPHVLINQDGSDLIQVVDGKSKAARHVLQMTQGVHTLLLARYNAAGKPEDGWIFPKANDAAEHISDGLTKGQYRKALADSKVTDFVPYTMRHTALTRFGEAADNNIFAVAQIASHTSLTTTKRYVHPQAERHALRDLRKILGGAKRGETSEQNRSCAMQLLFPPSTVFFHPVQQLIQWNIGRFRPGFHNKRQGMRRVGLRHRGMRNWYLAGPRHNYTSPGNAAPTGTAVGIVKKAPCLAGILLSILK
jgi:integrase